MKENRKLELFLGSEDKAGELTLRPMSGASRAILQRVNSPFATGIIEKPEDDEQAFFDFLFVHLAPIPEVISASHNPESFADKSLEYAFNYDLPTIKKLEKLAREKIREITDSEYEIKQDADVKKN